MRERCRNLIVGVNDRVEFAVLGVVGKGISLVREVDVVFIIVGVFFFGFGGRGFRRFSVG